MVDDFGKKLMHNNERKLRKGGLNMAGFSRRMKFVNVYHQLTLTKSFMKCWLSDSVVSEWLRLSDPFNNLRQILHVGKFYM